MLRYLLGPWGKACLDLDSLAWTLGECRVVTTARVTGQASPEYLLGLDTGQIRRALSLDFVRAQTLCLITRLCHLGEGAKEAAHRRQVAAGEVEEARGEQNAHFRAHIRGREGRRVGEIYRRS